MPAIPCGVTRDGIRTCCSTLKELLDFVVLCDNCINFKTADLGGKECAVMKEKKKILCGSLFLFCK